MSRDLILAGLHVSGECPKRMYNGPCGGMQRGLCEVEGDCIWYKAYARLKSQGKLEEFAKVSSAVAFPVFESSVGPVRAIEHFADETLRTRVIPRVCKGELTVAVAMSEPEAGTALTDAFSDPFPERC